MRARSLDRSYDRFTVSKEASRDFSLIMAPRIPSVLYQVAFGHAFVTCLVTVWTICRIIRALPGLGSKRRRRELSIAAASLCFHYIMLVPCPWIKLRGVSELQDSWKHIEKEATPIIIANHNSKLDSLLITALLPVRFGPRLRSLIKDALFREPLFGYICGTSCTTSLKRRRS